MSPVGAIEAMSKAWKRSLAVSHGDPPLMLAGDQARQTDLSAAAPTSARPSNRALHYLKESSAAAICITNDAGRCRVRNGHDKPGIVAVYWTNATVAPLIVVKARRHAGEHPSCDGLVKSLHHVARLERVALTPNLTALKRAEESVRRLDDYLDAFRKNGGLQEFNRQYQIRRFAAHQRGDGFMNYASALTRLKHALAPVLSAGGTTADLQLVFKEIFEVRR